MEKRCFTHTALAEQRGFTLVEVLVVMIVIGILAGIAIPVLLGQREQAQDASAKSDLRNALTTLVVFRTENGSFPQGLAADETALEDAQPALGWEASSGVRTRLDLDSRVGVIPFEWLTNGGADAVFGTRSASGRCFYAAHLPSGVTYGTSTVCDDPWEEFHENGGVRDSSW